MNMETRRMMKIVNTAVPLVLFLLFFCFVVMSMFADGYDETETWTNRAFILFGVMVVVMIIIAALNWFVFRKGGNVETAAMTKKCSSCGKTMNATDASCPHCHAIQPWNGDEVKK